MPLSKTTTARANSSAFSRRWTQPTRRASAAQDLRLRPALIALIVRSYDAIVADSLTFHERQLALPKVRPRGRTTRHVGHNVLLPLSPREADVLRFPAYPTAWPDQSTCLTS